MKDLIGSVESFRHLSQDEINTILKSAIGTLTKATDEIAQYRANINWRDSTLQNTLDPRVPDERDEHRAEKLLFRSNFIKARGRVLENNVRAAQDWYNYCLSVKDAFMAGVFTTK